MCKKTTCPNAANCGVGAKSCKAKAMINPDDQIIISGKKSGDLHICDSSVTIYFVNQKDLTKTDSMKLPISEIRKALDEYMEKYMVSANSVNYK